MRRGQRLARIRARARRETARMLFIATHSGVVAIRTLWIGALARSGRATRGMLFAAVRHSRGAGVTRML